jgi:hypothetical protein
MKAMIVKWLIELAFDEIVKAMKKVAQRSDNKVDDKMCRVIVDSKADIIKSVKAAI